MTSKDIPAFLTHYYEASEQPFSSLSDLDGASLEKKFAELAPLPMRLHRFKSAQAACEYMQLRREAEARVRLQFISKGGTPILQHPRYMVLGTCRWFDDWYVEKREIRVPLDEFDDRQISFTYPDALVSMVLAERQQWAPFRKPHHGITFTKNEIREVVTTYGLPNEDDPAALRIEERLIEAQIWDMAPLQSHLPKASTNDA
jgi:hypothetical protein